MHSKYVTATRKNHLHTSPWGQWVCNHELLQQLLRKKVGQVGSLLLLLITAPLQLRENVFGTGLPFIRRKRQLPAETTKCWTVEWSRVLNTANEWAREKGRKKQTNPIVLPRTDIRSPHIPAYMIPIFKPFDWFLPPIQSFGSSFNRLLD